MSLPKNHLELLSPARDVAIAREAILHGADAIYIGGPSFGARHNACNEVSEIAELVEFARRYHARVFTTINTILHDNELEPARKLIHQLYDAGVDVHKDDALGYLQLTDAGLAARDEHVMRHCLGRDIPVVGVIGGGYSKDREALARRHGILHHSAAKVMGCSQ